MVHSRLFENGSGLLEKERCQLMNAESFIVRDTRNPKVIISAKVKPVVKKKLEHLAKQNGLTVSSVAAQCIDYASRHQE